MTQSRRSATRGASRHPARPARPPRASQEPLARGSRFRGHLATWLAGGAAGHSERARGAAVAPARRAAHRAPSTAGRAGPALGLPCRGISAGQAISLARPARRTRLRSGPRARAHRTPRAPRLFDTAVQQSPILFSDPRNSGQIALSYMILKGDRTFYFTHEGVVFGEIEGGGNPWHPYRTRQCTRPCSEGRVS